VPEPAALGSLGMFGLGVLLIGVFLGMRRRDCWTDVLAARHLQPPATGVALLWATTSAAAAGRVHPPTGMATALSASLVQPRHGFAIRLRGGAWKCM